MQEKNISIIGRQESPVKTVLRLSLPAILEQIMFTAVTYVDTAMVGVLGASATAAVGINSSCVWLIGGTLSAMGVGFSVQIAQRAGANDIEGARNVVRTAVFTCISVGIVAGILLQMIAPFIPIWMGGAPEVIFTNTRKTGELTISKTVDGNDSDANKAFDITVTFAAPTVQDVKAPLNGSYTGTQNGVPVTGGVTGETWTKTFTLKGGESVTFTGLLEGTAYTVTEDDYRTEGYVTKVNGVEVEDYNDGLSVTGKISSTGTGKVAYTNIRDTGDLIISKTVAGTGGEEDRAFDFTLTLEKNEHGANVDDDYDTTLTTTTDEGTTTKTGTLTVSNGTATSSIQMTHGQTLTIQGLPDKAAYTVTESDNAGYSVTASGQAGEISNDHTAEAGFRNYRGGGGGRDDDDDDPPPPKKPPEIPETGMNWVLPALLALAGGARSEEHTSELQSPA
mgnify:CR=1 FL=1